MQRPDIAYFDPRKETAISRNRLPHRQQPGAAFFVTFRLADALPKEKQDRWYEEKRIWMMEHPEPWTPEDEIDFENRFPLRLEKWLDAGHGSCVLRDPENARFAAEALLHFDGQRVNVFSFVVMPNHIHALFQILEALLSASHKSPDATNRPALANRLFRPHDPRRIAPPTLRALHPE